MAEFIPRAPLPQQQVDRGPQVRNTVRYDDSGGQAIAQALGGIGQQLGDYAQQRIEQEDTAALLAARRALSEWEHTTFDPSNPEGIGRFRGLNALGARDELLPDLDRRAAEVSADMSPRQKARFGQVVEQFRDGIGNRLNSYMDREHTAARRAEVEASIGSLQRDAATAGMNGDMERQEELLAELQAANEARLLAEGMGESVIAESNRLAVSSVRRQTIEAIAATDSYRAVDLLNEYRDQLTPDDRQRVEAVVYPVVQADAARTNVDRLFAGQAVAADNPDDVDAAIVALESGGAADARNPDSTATGAGQFIESTWLDLVERHRPDLARGRTQEELLALRTDGDLSRQMVTAYRRENQAYLQSRGVATTAENLYAAHHFGPAGGAKFGKASNDTPMAEILTAGQLRANSYLRGKTKGEAIAQWAQRGLPVTGESVIPPQGRSESAMLAWVRANVRDPRMREGMQREIRERFALRDLAEREDHKAWAERVNVTMQEADPSLPLQRILSPADYQKAVREGKVQSLESLRMHRIKGTFVQDDLPFKEELYREAVTNPDAFLQRDFNDPDVQVRLATDSLAWFKGMQADAMKPGKRDEWASEAELLRQAYADIGIVGSGTKKAEQRDELQRAYLREKRAFNERNNGRNPTASEAQAILNGLKQPMVRSTWFGLGSTAQPLYRAGEGFQVPADVRVEIINGLRAAGIASPTEAQVVEAYRRGAGDAL